MRSELSGRIQLGNQNAQARMAVTKCEKCGAQLAASACACPRCATPAPVSPAKSDTSKKLIQALGIVAACIVASLLLATWLRKDSVASQKNPPAIKLEDITARANRGEAEAQKQLGAVFGKGEVVR